MKGEGDSPGAGPWSRLQAGLRRTFSTSILSNFFWSVLNTVLSRGLRLVAITLCVRQMGAESWGEVASTVALLSLVGLLVSQGLTGLPQIFRVNERELDRPLLLNICAYRLLMAVLVIAGMRLLAARVGIGSLALLYSWVLVLRALNIEWLLHRRERYHLTAVLASVRAAFFILLVMAYIGPGASARTVILMELAAEGAGVLAGYYLLSRSRIPLPKGGALPLGAMLLAALPVFLSEALHVLPVTVDILFLRLHHGLRAVAEYDIGARIAMAYFLLGGTWVQIVLPKLSRFHADGDRDAMHRVLKVSSGALLALGSLLLLPSLYFASEIVRLLFDKDFASTAFTFRWMSVWVYVSFMTMLNTIVLLATGRRRKYFYGALLATAVNVAANALLIRGFAVPGAVAARLLGEAVFFAYAIRMLPEGIRGVYSGEIRVQAGMLAALIALYGVTISISDSPAARAGGFALSLLLCAVVFRRRRVLSRQTLRTLHTH